MNRQETLAFIRDNSRAISTAEIPTHTGMVELEVRKGDNGQLFILEVFPRGGFTIFYEENTLQLAEVLKRFASMTGAVAPQWEGKGV